MPPIAGTTNVTANHEVNPAVAFGNDRLQKLWAN
jgi:hypothetical protein